jgi:hypothetical protein
VSVKKERSSLARLAKFVGDAAFIAALVAWIVEGSKPAPAPQRGLMALGFFVCGVVDIGGLWSTARRQIKRTDGKISVSFSLALFLAYDRATPHYAHGRPLWLTAFSIVILVGVVISVALGAYILRRTEDERQRALVNASLAFAFLATLTVVMVFAFLQSSNVGPKLEPSYVFTTAAAGFFAAFFVLRRRM